MRKKIEKTTEKSKNKQHQSEKKESTKPKI